VNDALLLVDVVNDFRHEDGGVLLASFSVRHGGWWPSSSEHAARCPSST